MKKRRHGTFQKNRKKRSYIKNDKSAKFHIISAGQRREQQHFIKRLDFYNLDFYFTTKGFPNIKSSLTQKYEMLIKIFLSTKNTRYIM